MHLQASSYTSWIPSSGLSLPSYTLLYREYFVSCCYPYSQPLGVAFYLFIITYSSLTTIWIRPSILSPSATHGGLFWTAIYHVYHIIYWCSPFYLVDSIFYLACFLWKLPSTMSSEASQPCNLLDYYLTPYYLHQPLPGLYTTSILGTSTALHPYKAVSRMLPERMIIVILNMLNAKRMTYNATWMAMEYPEKSMWWSPACNPNAPIPFSTFMKLPPYYILYSRCNATIIECKIWF